MTFYNFKAQRNLLYKIQNQLIILHNCHNLCCANVFIHWKLHLWITRPWWWCSDSLIQKIKLKLFIYQINGLSSAHWPLRCHCSLQSNVQELNIFCLRNLHETFSESNSQPNVLKWYQQKVIVCSWWRLISLYYTFLLFSLILILIISGEQIQSTYLILMYSQNDYKER